MTLLNYDQPIPETASVTCDDCFWTASGPWSHKAGREHGDLTQKSGARHRTHLHTRRLGHS
jgi:hypothetical protein